MAGSLYPRFAEPRLVEALGDAPVVLVHGPRQCGKTTLARHVGDAAGYTYINFDDAAALAAAEADPVGFVGDLPARTVLDEVQRAPGIFVALKTAVDRDRTKGRFILTGSANVLLVPKLADSLAGRMEILRLHPLSQGELARREPGFLDALFGASFETRPAQRLGLALAERIVAGGYPAAVARTSPRRRAQPGTATTSRPSSSATFATWRASARSTRSPGSCSLRPDRPRDSSTSPTSPRPSSSAVQR